MSEPQQIESVADVAGLVAINHTQRLYVMPCGDGVSCYGFDVLERHTRGLAVFACAPDLMPTADKGTRAAFVQYTRARDAAHAFHKRTGARAEYDLIPELIGLEGKRIEVERDGERVRFIVGKSTGWAPIHLEIERRNSSGGGSVYWPKGSRVVRVLKN